MKKLLLIPALLAGSLALADQKKYEISPMIGYNFAEGNLNIKDNGYPVGGLELQFNTPDSKISPEFSLLYSQGVDYKTNTAIKYKPGQDTKVMRGAFNGVYTFDAMNTVVPFAKLGGGAEQISNQNYSVDNGFFFDAGAGAKVPFTKNIAFKLEAIYMAKVGTHNSGLADSNLVTMLGLTFAFGGAEVKAAPKPVVVEEVAKKELVQAAPVAVVAPVIIDGDDDNDGILNSVDTCPKTLVGAKVDDKGCNVDLDNDGVLNVNDICPKTLVGAKVDDKGCNVDLDNDGVLNVNDICPKTLVGSKVDDKGCNVDLDNDGVLNVNDICPNTRAGDLVNSDGCPKTIALKINFEYNSDNIKKESEPKIEEYADFLSKHTNYSAKVIGYTDSVGSALYNQKLSEKRAKAIVRDLISKGVDAKQLSAFGAGETNPIADNATEEGRAKNRRIDVELTRN